MKQWCARNNLKEKVVSQETRNAKVMPEYLGALGYFLVGSGDRYPHKPFIEMLSICPTQVEVISHTQVLSSV